FGTQRKLPNRIEKDESKFYYLQKYQGQDWRIHLDLANTQNMEEESSYAKQIWGIYLHEILAHIESADDIEKTISRAAYAGLLGADDKVQVFQIVEQLLNHPLLSAYYKAGLHVANETDLVDEAGKLHRPDRLVFFKDKTIVIDYKTGKINEKHKKQIQEYADLLALMKYPNPECYLVYLDQNIEVVQI
ncbi:MAG: hypothetical protein JW729_04430, partial [Bacteroidales bacterium]|nr:hypothetical protein [Bacteroidales bacterium]